MELKRLNKQRDSVWIQDNGVMEIRVALQTKPDGASYAHQSSDSHLADTHPGQLVDYYWSGTGREWPPRWDGLQKAVRFFPNS